MKQHMLEFLATRPEDELSKILSWAQTQGEKLDDITPFEQRALDTAHTAWFKLEIVK